MNATYKPNEIPDHGKGKIIMNLPCKHSIQSMKQEEAGYHCASCDKHLIDFRGKKRQEIIEQIATTPGKVCGVFHRNQFEFKVSTVAFSAAQARIGLSLLGILGFLGPVVSSCEPAPEDATELKQHAFNQLKFPMHIKGVLINEKTGKPVKNGTIQILQNKQVIRKGRTDETGHFDLVLEKNDLIKDVFELVYGGKGILQDTLKKNSLKQNKIQLTIQAEPSACEMPVGKIDSKTINQTSYPLPGEMIIDGGVEYVEPLPELGEPAIEAPNNP